MDFAITIALCVIGVCIAVYIMADKIFLKYYERKTEFLANLLLALDKTIADIREKNKG